MSKISLVTGATGHLGNNLVRALLQKGEKVRAGARSVQKMKNLEGLDCELVHADLLDKKSLQKAMKGVDTLYQVAAVFKHWAKDPQKEIIEANLEMTKNVLEAAAQEGVKKVAYVSSIGALDHESTPMNETSWNKDYANPYYLAKTETEQLAWRLAKKLDLWMVALLPGAIVGPNCFKDLTPSMEMLNKILNNKMPTDPNFTFNYVDVKDVADGIIAGVEKGRSGERYILATETPVNTTQIFTLANSLYPKVKIPSIASKRFLKIFAFFSETFSKITGNTPGLLKSQVNLYYDADARIDITKSKTELGYSPKDPLAALEEAIVYLHNTGKTVDQ